VMMAIVSFRKRYYRNRLRSCFVTRIVDGPMARRHSGLAQVQANGLCERYDKASRLTGNNKDRAAQFAPHGATNASVLVSRHLPPAGYREDN
jgi:hypothetical protein